MKSLIFVSTVALLFTPAYLSGDTPPAGDTNPAGDDKNKVLKLCRSIFRDYGGLDMRGVSIFRKLEDPQFTRLFTSSLLMEFSAAQEQIERLRKAEAKKEVPAKLPFPEGGILTGVYEVSEDWNLESLARSGNVINANVAIYLQKGGKPAETITISLHDESGTLKVDDITYLSREQSIRDVIKDIFR